MRAVIIHGNETTKDYVILREMKLRPEMQFSDATLEDDRNRIYNLQLFNKVDADAVKEAEGVTIHIYVSERWYLFPYPVLGFRYRDPEKFYYGAGVVHQNFGGRNEKLFGSFAFGYDRWISLNYQNPKLTDSGDVYFRFQGGSQLVHSLTTTSSEYEQVRSWLGVSGGTRIGLFQHIVGTVGYEIWTVSDLQLARTVSSSGRDAFLHAGVQYWYDNRDDREYTMSGSYLMGFATKSGIGESDVNFFTYGADVRHFIRLTEYCSFGARVFGTLQAGGRIPPYRHVFYGYGERLRGYYYDVFEGEDIVGVAGELRFPLLPIRFFRVSFIQVPQLRDLRYGLSLVVFANGGKVWYRSDQFDVAPGLTGYGIGLQFLLPYGLNIEADIAVNDLGTKQLLLDFGLSL